MDNTQEWLTPPTPGQWPAGTHIDLLSVPWDAQYRNIVNFTSRDDLNAYIDNRVETYHRIEGMTYLRPYTPIRVNIPFNRVIANNYVRVNNPRNPVGWEGAERTYNDRTMPFYYFILDARMISPNTTELHVQLDVWNTYKWDMRAYGGYVERGHVGVANTPRMTDYGATYLTVPEGIDLGNEYAIQMTHRQKITDVSNATVLVWSTTELTGDHGTVEQPVLRTAAGTTFEDLPNGASCYSFSDPLKFVGWLGGMANKPWVTQGIVSVMVVPPLGDYGVSPTGSGDMKRPVGKSQPKTRDNVQNWREVLKSKIPERYRHLDKFLTFPYCVVELTTNTGAPLALKPELWKDSDFKVREVPYFALPAPRLVIHPLFYNYGSERTGTTGISDGGEFLDVATGIFNFPQFSVVNNGAMLTIASQAHSIQYQNSQADWSHQRTLAGAQTAYDQAGSAENLAQRQSDLGVGMANSQAALQNQFGAQRAGVSAIGSVGMGALSGSPMGLVGGAMSAAMTGVNESINQSERNAMTSLTTGHMRSMTQAGLEHSGYVADSNLSLAKFAAKGDYAQAVAGINARVQDAKLTQPTTSGQVGGEAFNLATDQWGYDVKVKTVGSGAMRMIGEYWLRYGYAVNHFMTIVKLDVMTKFSYWKFAEYDFTSANIPENYRGAIRGIFEKGVTVWKNPDDIGVTDPGTNKPIEGTYYHV